MADGLVARRALVLGNTGDSLLWTDTLNSLSSPLGLCLFVKCFLCMDLLGFTGVFTASHGSMYMNAMLVGCVYVEKRMSNT